MRPFTTPYRVALPEAALQQARRFAQAVVDTTDYRDSNQTQRRKIEDDHFISKIGEEAVKSVFQHLNQSVEGPDYAIYTGNQKSWAEDLRVEGVAIAVKTQKRSAALRYGLSWTFQCSGTRRDPILQQPQAWVCLVECDDLNGYACTVYPPRQIGQLIFRDPVLAHLQGKKKVVYAEDWK